MEIDLKSIADLVTKTVSSVIDDRRARFCEPPLQPAEVTVFVSTLFDELLASAVNRIPGGEPTVEMAPYVDASVLTPGALHRISPSNPFDITNARRKIMAAAMAPGPARDAAMRALGMPTDAQVESDGAA
jgi:hypothetical protein